MQARREGVWAWIARSAISVKSVPAGPRLRLRTRPHVISTRRASEKKRQLQRRIRELPGDV
jgi:hypothetical protein